MNAEDFRALADRAATIEGRRDDRLVEVHDRIRRAGRRRQLVAVTASAIAVVLAMTAGVGLLALTDNDSPPPAKPAPRPTSTPRAPDNAESVRRVTYATGDKIHWGDRVIDVDSEVTGVAATDDGVVFVRGGVKLATACRFEAVSGGCGELLFTDGSDIIQIGRVFGTGVRGYRIEVSSAGSTVVWFEPAPDERGRNSTYRERGEYVVYDTGKRREVARFGSPDSDLKGVYDDYLYWIPDVEAQCLDFSKYYQECRRYDRVTRLETSTGVQTQVAWARFASDRGSRPRMFVVPIRGEANTPGPVYDERIGFGREGDRLVADDGGGAAATVRLARTGEPLRLRLPAGYHDDVESFFFEMWLDDDRFVLSADNREDMLTCRLSSGRCRLAARGPTSASGFY